MKAATPVRRWLLRRILIAFVILLAAQSTLVFVGVRVSLSAYERYRTTSFVNLAQDLLIHGVDRVPEVYDVTGPFIVYRADGETVFSNRGRGRSVPIDERIPVVVDGSALGSWYAGNTRFLDDAGNRVFASTLAWLIAVSLLVSVAIGAVASVASARRVSEPLAVFRRDIRRIEAGDAVDPRDVEITELADISRSLSSLSSALRDQEDYKRRWMQDIAHDLRTPVAGLRGQLEGMRDGVLSIDPSRLERNLREIDRLESLVEGISDLYHLESMDSVETETFGVQRWLEELTTPWERLLADRSLDVNPHTDVDWIRGDHELLTRAATNLLGNAARYANEGSPIDLVVTRVEGEFVVEITNTGSPIPEHDLGRIFNRFYRGDAGRSSSGTGLGLPIAMEIMRKHRGTVRGENLEDGRIRFTARWPGEVD